MERCYDDDDDDNSTTCSAVTGTMGDYRTPTTNDIFLGHSLNAVLSFPLYTLAILLPIQLLLRFLNKRNTRQQQPNLGNLTNLNTLLALGLACLLSCKMTLEGDDHVEVTDFEFYSQFSPARIQVATYILVAFLGILEKTRLSNLTLTLLTFWTSTLITSSIALYHGLQDEAFKDKPTMFWIDLTHILIALLQCCIQYLKKKASESVRTVDVDHPQERASWLSDFTLFWTLDLIKKGIKHELQESDVYDLAPSDKCRGAVAKFERNLKLEELAKKLTNEDRNISELRENKMEADTLFDEDKKEDVEPAHISILSLLLKTYGLKYFAIQFTKALLEQAGFIHPLLMGLFMNHISNRENEHWARGVGIVCFIFFMEVLIHISHHRLWGTTLRFGKQLRASIILTVFKKALIVQNESKKDMTTGEIVNLISDDCDRVVNLSQELFHLLATPMRVAVSMYLLYNLVGSAMLVGLFIMILLIPLNRYVGKKMKTLYTERDEAKEKRTKLMNEIINGMKVLKLYAWENSFMEKVHEIRGKEEECNNQISFLSACIDSMFRAIPFLVKLCSFGMYILLGGQLDATTGFIAMHLFHILNFPFSLMPLLIPRYVEAAASLKRIEKFMNGEDIPIDNITRKAKSLSNSAISIDGGDFTWERSRETNTLRNINVDVPKGSLVAVVGMVGTGKSSLLSAMLGEMERVKGHVEVQGKIAYVPQEAWIINAPLKDNVLFGSPMNSARFKGVIDACALKHDIDMMKGGERTEIGEKGINLSGGQKQRVSLARALYNNADVYLFDDPLSAVDAHVGKHIFNKVIGDTGVLRGKTRVLVTHGLHWLQRVDSIIVMKDGEISESGTYEQLLSHDGAFAQFLRNALATSSEETNSKARRATVRSLSRLESMNSNNNDYEDTKVESSSESSSSAYSSADEHDETEALFDENKSNDDDGTLIDDEELEQGQVDKKVYLQYIKAIGYKTVSLFVIIALVTSIFDSYNSLTLKQWTDDPVLNNESLSDTVEYNHIKWNHFMLFGVSGGVEVIAAFLFVLTILSQTFQAATRLHNNLLYKILRCPMSFFDTTPSCRVLLRFSKDVSRVDGLGGCLRGLVMCVSNMIIFLTMIIINSPAVVYYLIPITITYYFLFKYHIGTIRQLRRYRSKYQSPMYTHFTETLNGLSSIRAYACQQRFINKMENHIDEFVKFDLLEHWASLGLGMRSGFLYHMIVFVSGLVCVMDSSMTAGMVGLTILFASSFTGTMNGFFWTVTHTETEIIALEKLIEYSNKPSEAEWEIEETKPTVDWPVDGHVTFNSYKARYRDGLDLVLKGVDCKIQSGEKVGIVGRTGAGKTSLTMGFFRLLEAADGKITVDGDHIANLGLHNLRSRINILPQEPVIFSGSLKMNLDPFGKHTDEEIWTALERSHLEPFIRTLPKELDFECDEGGKNLSVGQRQLLCLARTLLRKTKILVLDEATAAVDMETDELIQKTIRSEFKDCTVLTIAHRLNTILDYDKIMVLEFGTVKEFDSPKKLLADENSTFYSMAKDAKLVKS